jgi:hypothetical protein
VICFKYVIVNTLYKDDDGNDDDDDYSVKVGSAVVESLSCEI